jgi:hypothetical protein
VPSIGSRPAPPLPPVLQPGHMPEQVRQMMISEFGEWLRSRTNRHNRPFQEETISAYKDAAVALGAWMTKTGLARPRHLPATCMYAVRTGKRTPLMRYGSAPVVGDR